MPSRCLPLGMRICRPEAQHADARLDKTQAAIDALFAREFPINRAHAGGPRSAAPATIVTSAAAPGTRPHSRPPACATGERDDKST